MKYFMRVIVLVLIFFVSLTGTIQAQDLKSRRLMKADLAFDNEQYFIAAELYKKAYKKTKNRAVKADIIFKQAECYRKSLNYKRAASYYKRAIKAKYTDVIVYLHYADVLRMQENYEGAADQYKKYMKLNPTDIKGEMGLRSCEFAQQWLSNPTRYKVVLMPLVNSRYNDYSPSFGTSEYDELYFTSSREGGLTNEIDERTGENYTDIYFTKLGKKEKWSAPTTLPAPINTTANEATSFLNDRGTTMYFTKCSVEKKKISYCSINTSTRKGKLWGDPNVLQIKIDSNITIGHPTVSEDKEGFLLIFSSDMSGGYGGNDLWVTTKEKRNGWSTPINMGPAINTHGDEMFPFLHTDGDLYFASTGHIGMGGLDIFKASKDENGLYSSVTNLKYPINSPADDFGIIVEQSGERGYLSSNRDGGKGGDDIYQFELPPLEFNVKGVVTDSKTGVILTGVTIQLVNTNGIKSNNITDNTGTYTSDLQPLSSYEIVVNTEGYLKKTALVTTENIHYNKTFIVDLVLDPIKKEIVLPRIEYDFAKWDLRPQSIADLDLLIKTLQDNPNVTIELKSHTDFRGTDMQNNRLSQKRAEVCVDYLINNGINANRLVAIGEGETEPFVIEIKDGRFKEGDVLTEHYINKIRFKKNKEKAHQYNRRTSFKVLSEDFVPVAENVTSKEKK
ncbi:OmpA family protein [Flavobacteriales bacterium]|nr:OmpA family protein [Flavobacteriales bacterium]